MLFFSIKFRKKINTSRLLTLKLNGCSLISVKVLSQQRVSCFYFSSACTHPKDHYISPPLSNQSYVCHKENLYWLWILGSSMSCSVTLIISMCVVFSKDKDDCFFFFFFLCPLLNVLCCYNSSWEQKITRKKNKVKKHQSTTKIKKKKHQGGKLFTKNWGDGSSNENIWFIAKYSYL